MFYDLRAKLLILHRS